MDQQTFKFKVVKDLTTDTQRCRRRFLNNTFMDAAKRKRISLLERSHMLLNYEVIMH